MIYDPDKTVCVSGHRDIPEDKVAYVKSKLHNEVIKAIDDGFSTFISGMAKATDLYFASIVASLKASHHLTLVAAIPYRRRLHTPDPLFQDILSCCDIVEVVSEGYTQSCYARRNRFMLLHSKRLIAVYDGRQNGGTYSTIMLAGSTGKDIRLIKI